MPLWDKVSKRPVYVKNQGQERIYATPKGWVQRHPNGTEEILVAIGNLDTTLPSPTLEAIYFSNTALALKPKVVAATSYTQNSSFYVTASHSHTVSVLQALTYTGVSNGAFVNGEILVQGSNVATGTIQQANSTILQTYQGGAKFGLGAGQFVVTANSSTTIRGSTSGAVANISVITGPVINVASTGGYVGNVVAKFYSVGPANNCVNFLVTPASFVDAVLTYTGVSNGAFVNGHTITQSSTGVSGIISGSNSTVLSVNNSTGAWALTTNAASQLVDSGGAFANISVIVANSAVYSIPAQTIGTNTSVNIVANTTVNADATFASGDVKPLQGMTSTGSATTLIVT